MDSISERIGAVEGDMSPWYGASYDFICRAGGRSVLRCYNDSIYSMLRNIYPNQKWLPWKFKYLPKKITRNDEVKRLAVEYLEVELKIENVDDWRRISSAKLQDLGLNYIVNQNGGLWSLLKEVKPEFALTRASPRS